MVGEVLSGFRVPDKALFHNQDNYRPCGIVEGSEGCIEKLLAIFQVAFDRKAANSAKSFRIMSSEMFLNWKCHLDDVRSGQAFECDITFTLWACP